MNMWSELLSAGPPPQVHAVAVPGLGQNQGPGASSGSPTSVAGAQALGPCASDFLMTTSRDPLTMMASQAVALPTVPQPWPLRLIRTQSF